MSSSSSSCILPRFVVIKSKDFGKYLKRVSKEESTEKKIPQTFLNFLGDDISSHYIKFELEEAKKDPELVHIKCCHNNKYLNIQYLTCDIEATSDHPVEEDVEDYGRKCTMYKPIRATEFHDEEDDHGQYFRFLHPSTGFYVCIDPPPYYTGKDYGLIAGQLRSYKYNVFKVLDWESLVIFPKTTQVAFKVPGDYNNKYLCRSWITDHENLHYRFCTDSGDQTIRNGISTFGDGYVRIYNYTSGMFWMASPNWVWTESRDTSGQDKETLFWPIKLADNIIALRAWTNSKFCMSLTSDGVVDCLNAHSPTITDEVKLEVVENIISKTICGVRFHKDEAKIYKPNVVQKGFASADNYEDEENIISLKFSYKKTSSSSFGSSHSLKLGGKTTFKVNLIPFVAKGGLDFNFDYTYVHHWGETTTTETLTEATYTAKLPKKTKIKVTLVATQGMCDVPFSYTQRDILYDGNIIIRNMEDGIYKGINMFNFEFRSEYEKLDPTYNYKTHTSINQSNIIY